MIWTRVPGHDCEVTAAGEVRGKTRVLGGWIDKDGYRRVHVRVDGKWKQVPVHTLVCLAFHGPRPTPAHEVAHGDGSRTNNAEGNLRWATSLEQSADQRRHGTIPLGERTGAAKLTDADVRQIRTIWAKSGNRPTISELARRFGVRRPSITRVVTGKGWTHVA